MPGGVFYARWRFFMPGGVFLYHQEPMVLSLGTKLTRLHAARFDCINLV